MLYVVAEVWQTASFRTRPVRHDPWRQARCTLTGAGRERGYTYLAGRHPKKLFCDLGSVIFIINELALQKIDASSYIERL